MSYHNHHILQIFHLWTIIYFDRYKICLLKKIWFFLEVCKNLKQFFVKKPAKFFENKIMKLSKRWYKRSKYIHNCSIKLLFYLKKSEITYYTI